MAKRTKPKTLEQGLRRLVEIGEGYRPRRHRSARLGSLQMDRLAAFVMGLRTRFEDGGRFYPFDFETLRERVEAVEETLISRNRLIVPTDRVAQIRRRQSRAAKKAWAFRKAAAKAKAKRESRKEES